MNKNNFKKILENIWSTIKSVLNYIGLSFWQYFILFFVLYIIYFIYNFFPKILDFWNITIFFLIFFFSYLYNKRSELKKFFSEYIESLNDLFYLLRDIFSYVLYFWFFLLFISWQELSALIWMFVVYYISLFFWYFYNKKDKYFSLFEKFDYKNNNLLILIFISNLFIFLYLKKILILNDIQNIYFIIWIILALYNILAFILFIYVFWTKQKFNKNSLSFTNILYTFWIIFMVFLFLDRYNNQIIIKKQNEAKIIAEKIEYMKKQAEEERKIIKIATWTNIWSIPKKIDYSFLYDKVKIWDYYKFDRNIHLWDNGEDVEKIQEILSLESFYTWAINWIFDLQTSLSLQEFFKSKTKQDYSDLWIDWLSLWKIIEIQIRKNFIKNNNETSSSEWSFIIN